MVHQRSIGLPRGTPYDELLTGELPEVPERFNIASACSERQPAGNVALVVHEATGSHRLTFGDLVNRSARLASGLRAIGVMSGDRVAIVLPQRWEAVVAILAAHRLGAIALPLDPALGPDALGRRFVDAKPRVAVVDDASQRAVEAAGASEIVHTRNGRASVASLIAFHQPMPAAPTAADDPAFLFYEGLVDGPPVGVLLPHRALLGWMPSIELALDWFPEPGDVVWTDMSWAEPVALLGAVLPALYHGVPVVGALHTSPDPAEDLDLVGRDHVTCAVMSPDALRSVARSGVATDGLQVRAVAVAGTVGTEVQQWSQTALHAGVNTLIAPTRTGPCIGNAGSSWPNRSDTLGRPYPGFEVAIVDELGEELPAGIAGAIAVHEGHPAGFSGCWRDADAAVSMQVGQRVLTGLRGVREPDGAIRREFGSANGLIEQSGRLIGPWEMERCLEEDTEVLRAAVVGASDASHGEILKAYVVMKDRQRATPETAIRLATRCGERLAPYLAPKRISFVTELPMTAENQIDRILLGDR